MKRGHDLSGLMKFAESPAWAEYLSDVLAEHFGPALETHDCAFENLADVIGDHWAGTLWGCAFEDLATRTVDGGRNLVEEYLKRRGWNEAGPAKLYMRALRASVMSLYEVSAVEPGIGFLVRDLIRGGELVRVSERSASQTLRSWDRVGARVVAVGGRFLLAGGLLSFTVDAADAACGVIRNVAAKRGVPDDAPISDDLLRDFAPLISTTWLFDILPKALGTAPSPTLLNADGDEVVFHHLHFPFSRGVTQAKIAERLEGVAALQRETARFWNWLGEPAPPAKRGEGHTWSVTMADGTPVLGNIELKGRALVLSVSSADRARRGTALVQDALGNLVGPPSTEIETLEQTMAAGSGGGATRDVPPETATSLVHAMLDRQYRAVLDEPVPMLGHVSPRAAAESPAGRERLAAWLKHLENGGGRSSDPNDPMATYDFIWMWRELGIETLRR